MNHVVVLKFELNQNTNGLTIKSFIFVIQLVCGGAQGFAFLKSSQVELVVENLPINARDRRDLGLIPGLGRSLEEGVATHSSILQGGIPTDRGAW